MEKWPDCQTWSDCAGSQPAGPAPDCGFQQWPDCSTATNIQADIMYCYRIIMLLLCRLDWFLQIIMYKLYATNKHIL